MRSNPVKARLAAGGRAFGTMVFEFATPGLPTILSTAGADYALYCMEHSGFGVEEMKRQFQYCRATGIVPIVRPPDKSYATTALLLLRRQLHVHGERLAPRLPSRTRACCDVPC